MRPFQLTRYHALALAGIAGTGLLASAGTFAAEPKADDPSRAKLQQQLEDAQRRLDKAAREVADLSMSMSEDVLPRATASARRSQRALLGINIGSEDDDERQRADGVEVLSVSPGGGAAQAGLKSGDVLIALNNKALKRDAEGSAREKLLEIMREVKPGEKVTVKYLRDGRSSIANVAAKTVTERLFNERLFTATRPGRVERFEIPNLAFRRAEGVFGSAELVALTPKLGRYFGAEKGLLVVRAPADTRLEIEEGDVILDIDGRTPTSPSHALRILGSYAAGEKLKVNLLRMKRRTDVEITIPEDAPRARIERLQRSYMGAPAVPYHREGVAIAPPALPAVPAVPALPAPPPAIEVEPLEEEDVVIEKTY